MDWETVAPDFAADGGLRDIYVLDTTEDDWDAVLAWIRRSYDSDFSIGGVVAEIPARSADIFAQWAAEGVPHLRFRVGRVNVACRFFGPDEIEFDFIPREVAGVDTLEPLLEFMKQLGRITNKTVLLTPDNWKKSPIFRFGPGMASVEFCPPPAGEGSATL